MSTKPAALEVSTDQILAVFNRTKGNIRATATELGIARSTVRRRLTPLGVMKKPLVGGTKFGTQTEVRKPAKKGEIKRYILTSAQNNTHVNEELLDNLEALAAHYDAEILVGTYTYNQNAYGPKAIKRGSELTRDPKTFDKELWYDPAIEDYISDKRVQLAPGLVWCGEYNALPTNVNPLAGLESYSGRQSAIFPHAKLAMRSIPTMQGEGTKLNYTTGTVTMRNYIQKREGVIAEFHHIYGALLVEVDENGNWWVRQLNQDEGTGTLQDLNVIVLGGKIVSTTGAVESITFGDLHGVWVDRDIMRQSLEMRDTLQPHVIFLHDIMEGAAVNPHARKYKANFDRFNTWLRGYHVLEHELADTARILEQYADYEGKTVVVDSNHDDIWVKRWLQESSHKIDPPNAELHLKLNAYMYSQIRNGVTVDESRARTAKPKMVRDVNVLEYALYEAGNLSTEEGCEIRFLGADESYLTCGKKIENGMHGHLGPNGKFGSPIEFSKMGRKANTAHTHSAGIYNGLYVAGTSAQLRWDYAKGPNSHSHSHIITYQNGKRAVITMFAGKWRA